MNQEPTAAITIPPTIITDENYIEPARWGRDHWSTLAYIDSRMTDFGEPYLMGIDPKMRTKRRHLRVFAEANAFNSAKARTYYRTRGQTTIGQDDGSRLRDNTIVRNHDDFDCIQDFAAAGLLTVTPDKIEPGTAISFSDKGREVMGALRLHKQAGGQWIDFSWPYPGVVKLEDLPGFTGLKP